MKNLHTLRDFVRYGTSRFNEAELFFGHGTDNAIDEAVQLVLYVTHLDHGIPEHFWSAQLTDAERLQIFDLFHARVERRMPAAYLTNEAWFAGLKFYVNEHVLVPRSPMAELIKNDFAPWLQSQHLHQVLDLCTGSGCIGIASALALPHAKVDAVDISPEALAVAERNVMAYNLEQQVELLEGDLFSACQGRRYDLIISNPPYVDAEEMAALPEEYQREPALGLASGEDGLDITRRILAEAADYLQPDGFLIVEVGISQAALCEVYPEVDFIWLDFAQGGEGVFLLNRAQLEAYRDIFQQRIAPGSY